MLLQLRETIWYWWATNGLSTEKNRHAAGFQWIFNWAKQKNRIGYQCIVNWMQSDCDFSKNQGKQWNCESVNCISPSGTKGINRNPIAYQSVAYQYIDGQAVDYQQRRKNQ